MSNANRGSALIGALAAVFVSGTIGASMVAYYQSFVKQSRQLYVRSLMTSIDNKVRFLAMQPYAYVCANQRAGAGSANQLDGVSSCEINRVYFDGVARTVIPGACADAPPCGIRLEFRPTIPVNANPPLDFVNVPDPATGVSQLTGLLPYRLVYEGSDLQVSPGGYDLDQANVGMPIPREVLQSEEFNCAAADPSRPVFGGFDKQSGRPICRGFNECDTGSYGTALNFRQLNPGGATLRFECRSLRTPDKQVNCLRSGQGKISALSFDRGVLSASCSDLPIPELDYVAPSPVNGACGASHGLAVTAAPTGGLCTTGAASALAGAGPWTWTCAGQNGGTTASCTASRERPPGNLRYVAVNKWQGAMQGPWFLYSNADTGEACDANHQDIWWFGLAYPTLPRSAAPGNPPDCPSLVGDQSSTPPEGAPCSTIGARCYWQLQRYGRDLPSMAESWHSHVSNCKYLECRDEATCPDGSARAPGAWCPGTSGRWITAGPPMATPEGLGICGPAEVDNLPCSPVGQICAQAYGPTGFYRTYCR